MKKILLFTTGGTIASKEGMNGLEPDMHAEELLSYMGDLTSRYDITCQELLSLDSSNIQAEEWKKISENIYENIKKYDGIIVTHGTDTMAYTSSMMSFMLQNLPIPVVFTGSQMPIDNMLTDARNNLFSAFAAVDAGITGISLAFNRRIMRGCRAVKVRTLGFEAFESVNAPYLAEIFANGMRSYSKTITHTPTAPLLKDKICTDVFLLKLIPNTKPVIFDVLSKLGYRGIVLEAFGAGGLHFLRRNLLEKLEGLTAAGISVVACSQCLYEPSDFSIYEVGRRLLECGVIPGRDMTTEAAVTKLMWALGQTDDPEEVRRIFDTDLAGEVSL
ncbi:MAG: asparaginase [Clostridium sp.]